MSVRVFAPATVANVAVGFDILGFALQGVGDTVFVERSSQPRVELVEVSGLTSKIPLDPTKNVASVAVESLRRALGISFGFRISIHKGIPLASGMGGSAASSVGAVVGANALLDRPLEARQLLRFALEGERLTSGAAHADNAAACLLGGLVLTLPTRGSEKTKAEVDPFEVVPLSIPKNVCCVLVHPHCELETRASRAVLKPEITLAEHVLQSARLAAFVQACATGHLGLLKQSLRDDLIEPQRRHLIPGFDEVKRVALEAGALGFSISGSGPSVFAWVENLEGASRVQSAMVECFRSAGIASDAFVSSLPAPGARVIPHKES